MADERDRQTDGQSERDAEEGQGSSGSEAEEQAGTPGDEGQDGDGQASGNPDAAG